MSPKKSIFKHWWFWAIAVFVVLCIFIAAFPEAKTDSNQNGTTNSSASSITLNSDNAVTLEPKDTDSAENKESNTQKPETANSEATSDKQESSNVIVPDQSETGEDLVWVPTNGGTKYHSKSTCSNMKDPVQVSRQTAVNNGFGPCGKCKP